MITTFLTRITITDMITSIAIVTVITEIESAVERYSDHPFADPKSKPISLRSTDTTSPFGSRVQSRRESLTAKEPQHADHAVVTKEALQREKQQRAIRDEELRNSLSSLNDLSNTATCRLDETYYSVLEKLSSLQATISSLHDLSALAHTLQADFDAEAHDLETDVQGQIEDLSGFDTQQNKVEKLEERVMAGRRKTRDLGTRLDVVMRKVEGWERKEGEWQAKTSRRLRIFWSVVSVSILTFVALLIFQYLPGRPQSDGSPLALRFNGTMQFKDLLTELNIETSSSKPTLPSTGPLQAPTMRGSDDRLKLFDEL
ncbi:MAG: hypothetical protein M1817_002411 [Caeruleum heppii]|nr:MAG: hypothetical protein M1817_002411 [Caeruleum heppii]